MSRAKAKPQDDLTAEERRALLAYIESFREGLPYQAPEVLSGTVRLFLDTLSGMILDPEEAA
jgi:hypothetical protein